MTPSAATKTSDPKIHSTAVPSPPSVIHGDNASPYAEILKMQHTIGNRATGKIIQTKLSISSPGDRFEQEADRIAEEVLGAPRHASVHERKFGQSASATMQRACSDCDEEEKTLRRKISPAVVPIVSRVSNESSTCACDLKIQRKCTSCEEEERKSLQRKDTAGSNTVNNTNLESRLDSLKVSGGHALPDHVRSFFEPRFGADFGHVRIHTDARASETAAAVSARAFTLGHNIVFGAGQYAPQTPRGEKLLAHELTHVLQQRSYSAAVPMGEFSPAAAKQGINSTSAPLGRSTSLGSARESVQRAPEEKSDETTLAWYEAAAIDVAVGPSIVMGTGVHGLIHAAVRGLVLEVKSQLKAGRGGEFWARVKGLLKNPAEFGSFYVHYLWGLVKGIFSPITGLFDLAKLGVKLTELQVHIMQTAWSKREELAKDAGEFAANFNGFKQKAITALKALADNPKDTVKALSKWIDSAKEKAEKAAEGAGRSVGKAVFESLKKPWSEIGEFVGEVVGTALINVVLFIFTEGIGNAIVQIASKLGELGSMLGKMGKAAQMLGWVVEHLSSLLGTVGGFIAELEKAIATVAEALLKPLKPLMDEFGKLMGSLRTFLRRLLGVSDEAAAAGAEKLAAGAGSKIESNLPAGPKPTTKPTTPPPPEPKPKPKVTDTGKDVKPPTPTGQKPLEGLSEDATKLLKKNPQLADSLEHNPNAAAALKFCQSPCYFPEGLGNPAQVQRVEKVIAAAKSRGMDLNNKKLSQYFNLSTNEAELDAAIAEFEVAFRKVSSHPQTPGQLVLDEAELMDQLGMKVKKPVDIRLGEAEVGKKFDKIFSRIYPSNQVAIRDRTGTLRWLDSYDAKAGEIISRKSLAASRGQVWNTDEFKMIDHFQEFKLKYQNGATIADVPSARVQGFVPDTTGKMPKVTGKYILEVPKQDLPIPDRILQHAREHGITIRPTNFEVTNEYFTALGMFEK